MDIAQYSSDGQLSHLQRQVQSANKHIANLLNMLATISTWDDETKAHYCFSLMQTDSHMAIFVQYEEGKSE